LSRLIRAGLYLGTGLLIVAIGVLALQYVASERIEVVELHTIGSDGENVTTRLWVVDHDGVSYLRVGSEGSGWYTRLVANEEFNLTRQGETLPFRGVPRPGMSEEINDLMREKYIWGDSVIAMLVGNREGSIPIALTPARSADDNN